MKWLAGLVLFGFAANALADNYRWTRVAHVPPDKLTVVITHVPSQLKLKQIRQRFGGGDVAAARRYQLDGFSVLRRKGDTLKCEVFVRNLLDAVTIEHELRHCNGETHD